jgi:hypothetical protein
MAFWRRSKGRHALGAAVTSIPAAPRVLHAPVPLLPPASAQPPVSAPLALAPAPLPPAPAPLPAAPLLPAFEPLPVLPVQVAPEPTPAGPRVELTFRDGSSASLDAAQARALEELAQVLTRRD